MKPAVVSSSKPPAPTGGAGVQTNQSLKISPRRSAAHVSIDLSGATLVRLEPSAKFPVVGISRHGFSTAGISADARRSGARGGKGRKGRDGAATVGGVGEIDGRRGWGEGDKMNSSVGSRKDLGSVREGILDECEAEESDAQFPSIVIEHPDSGDHPLEPRGPSSNDLKNSGSQASTIIYLKIARPSSPFSSDLSDGENTTQIPTSPRNQATRMVDDSANQILRSTGLLETLGREIDADLFEDLVEKREEREMISSEEVFSDAVNNERTAENPENAGSVFCDDSDDIDAHRTTPQSVSIASPISPRSGFSTDDVQTPGRLSRKPVCVERDNRTTPKPPPRLSEFRGDDDGFVSGGSSRKVEKDPRATAIRSVLENFERMNQLRRLKEMSAVTIPIPLKSGGTQKSVLASRSLDKNSGDDAKPAGKAKRKTSKKSKMNDEVGIGGAVLESEDSKSSSGTRGKGGARGGSAAKGITDSKGIGNARQGRNTNSANSAEDGDEVETGSASKDESAGANNGLAVKSRKRKASPVTTGLADGVIARRLRPDGLAFGLLRAWGPASRRLQAYDCAARTKPIGCVNKLSRNCDVVLQGVQLSDDQEAIDESSVAKSIRSQTLGELAAQSTEKLARISGPASFRRHHAALMPFGLATRQALTPFLVQSHEAYRDGECVIRLTERPPRREMVRVDVRWDEVEEVEQVGAEGLSIWRLSDMEVEEMRLQVRREAEHRRTEHITPLVMAMTPDQVERTYGLVAEEMRAYDITECDSDLTITDDDKKSDLEGLEYDDEGDPGGLEPPPQQPLVDFKPLGPSAEALRTIRRSRRQFLCDPDPEEEELTDEEGGVQETEKVPVKRKVRRRRKRVEDWGRRKKTTKQAKLGTTKRVEETGRAESSESREGGNYGEPANVEKMADPQEEKMDRSGDESEKRDVAGNGLGDEDEEYEPSEPKRKVVSDLTPIGMMERCGGTMGQDIDGPAKPDSEICGQTIEPDFEPDVQALAGGTNELLSDQRHEPDSPRLGSEAYQKGNRGRLEKSGIGLSQNDCGDEREGEKKKRKIDAMHEMAERSKVARRESDAREDSEKNDSREYIEQATIADRGLQSKKIFNEISDEISKETHRNSLKKIADGGSDKDISEDDFALIDKRHGFAAIIPEATALEYSAIAPKANGPGTDDLSQDNRNFPSAICSQLESMESGKELKAGCALNDDNGMSLSAEGCVEADVDAAVDEAAMVMEDKLLQPEMVEAGKELETGRVCMEGVGGGLNNALDPAAVDCAADVESLPGCEQSSKVVDTLELAAMPVALDSHGTESLDLLEGHGTSKSLHKLKDHGTEKSSCDHDKGEASKSSRHHGDRGSSHSSASTASKNSMGVKKETRRSTDHVSRHHGKDSSRHSKHSSRHHHSRSKSRDGAKSSHHRQHSNRDDDHRHRKHRKDERHRTTETRSLDKSDRKSLHSIDGREKSGDRTKEKSRSDSKSPPKLSVMENRHRIVEPVKSQKKQDGERMPHREEPKTSSKDVQLTGKNSEGMVDKVKQTNETESGCSRKADRSNDVEAGKSHKSSRPMVHDWTTVKSHKVKSSFANDLQLWPAKTSRQLEIEAAMSQTNKRSTEGKSLLSIDKVTGRGEVKSDQPMENVVKQNTRMVPSNKDVQNKNKKKAKNSVKHVRRRFDDTFSVMKIMTVMPATRRGAHAATATSDTKRSSGKSMDALCETASSVGKPSTDGRRGSMNRFRRNNSKLRQRVKGKGNALSNISAKSNSASSKKLGQNADSKRRTDAEIVPRRDSPNAERNSHIAEIPRKPATSAITVASVRFAGKNIFDDYGKFFVDDEIETQITSEPTGASTESAPGDVESLSGGEGGEGPELKPPGESDVRSETETPQL